MLFTSSFTKARIRLNLKSNDGSDESEILNEKNVKSYISVQAVWQRWIRVGGTSWDDRDPCHDLPGSNKDWYIVSIRNDNQSGQNDFSREDAVLRAESMFAKLDVNGDGDLTEVGIWVTLNLKSYFKCFCSDWLIDWFQDEFVAGCLTDEVLVRRLTPSAEDGDWYELID